MTLTDSQIQAFYDELRNACEYSDIDYAISKCVDADLEPSVLVEVLKEHVECGSELADIDACDVAWNYILSNAQYAIEEILEKDVYDMGFRIAGNCRHTSLDFADEAHEKLEKVIKGTSAKQMKELLANGCVRVFLEDANIIEEEIFQC